MKFIINGGIVMESKVKNALDELVIHHPLFSHICESWVLFFQIMDHDLL
jgi:hypothetical protein